MAADLTSQSTGYLSFFIFLGFSLIILLSPFVFFLWRQKRIREFISEDLGDQPSMRKVAYRLEPDQDVPKHAYLRSLTSERATLVVSDRSLRKGNQLEIDLGSAKTADSDQSLVRGKVTQMKSLGGTPENILVNIEFLEHKEPIREFLQNSDLSSV